MTAVQMTTTEQENLDMEYLALIAPWMGCVACWAQLFEVEESGLSPHIQGDITAASKTEPAERVQLGVVALAF